MGIGFGPRHASIGVMLVAVAVLNLVGGWRQEQLISPVLYQFFLIPIIVTGYFFGLQASVVVAFVGALYGFGLLGWQTVTSGEVPELEQMGACILAMFNFYLVAVVLNSFWQKSAAREEELERESGELGSEYAELSRVHERMGMANDDLDLRGARLIELYEVTRQMSAVLDKDRILEIMSVALKRTFQFSRGELVLLEEPGSLEGSAMRYLLPGLQAIRVRIEADRRDLVERVLRSTKPVIVSAEHHVAGWELSSGVKSLAAAPLRVEEKAMGVLSIENPESLEGGYLVFDEELMEMLEVLAGQFALQVEKARLYARVQELSITDGLTGLYVRRHFFERLDEELKRSKRHGIPMCLVMLDIDHFKSYNDNYGHLVGDAVLREVARLIKESIREVDLACRYGGEEFTLMLPETEKEAGAQVAERVREAVDSHRFKAYDEEARVTVSAGVADFPEDGQDGMELIDKADEALLRAKRDGRNRVLKFGGQETA